MLTKEILVNLRLKCIGFFKEAIYMNENASYLVSQSYQFNLQKLDIAVEIALPKGEKLHLLEVLSLQCLGKRELVVVLLGFLRLRSGYRFFSYLFI